MPGNDCIEIFSCGTDGACQTGDDVLLGTGSVNSQGRFSVAVSPPLREGERIYARDTCTNQSGPPVLVTAPAPVPVLSMRSLLGLVCYLILLGIFGIRRLHVAR
jgi:hypothetical protein